MDCVKVHNSSSTYLVDTPAAELPGTEALLWSALPHNDLRPLITTSVHYPGSPVNRRTTRPILQNDCFRPRCQGDILKFHQTFESHLATHLGPIMPHSIYHPFSIRVGAIACLLVLFSHWISGPILGQPRQRRAKQPWRAQQVEELPAPRPTTRPSRPISGFPAGKRFLPELTPRPASGPESVSAFVAGISPQEPDAEIEVALGRPRLMTFHQNLATAQDAGSISVGDPTTADFEVLGKRQIRIVGVTPGDTDLVITHPNRGRFQIRVRVLYDLDTLQKQLNQLFPQARVRLRQIKEHILVDGIAGDPATAAQVLDIVNAYRASVTAKLPATR